MTERIDFVPIPRGLLANPEISAVAKLLFVAWMKWRGRSCTEIHQRAGIADTTAYRARRELRRHGINIGRSTDE